MFHFALCMFYSHCFCRYTYIFTLCIHICVFHFAFLLFSQAAHPFWFATCNLWGQTVVPCLCLPPPPAVERRWRHCTRNRNTTFTTVLRISEKIHVMRKLSNSKFQKGTLDSLVIPYLIFLAPQGALVVVSPTHPLTQSTFWWRCYLQLWCYFL